MSLILCILNFTTVKYKSQWNGPLTSSSFSFTHLWRQQVWGWVSTELLEEETHGLWKEDHSLPCGKDSMLLADEAKHQFVTWVKICLFSDQTLDWSLFTKSWLCSGKRKGLNLLQGVAPLTALDCLTFISVMSQYKTPSSAEDPNCLMWDTSEGQRLLSRLEALCTLRTQPNWIPHGPWTPQTHCVNGGRKRCSFRLIHDSVRHSQTVIWQNKAHILFNLC